MARAGAVWRPEPLLLALTREFEGGALVMLDLKQAYPKAALAASPAASSGDEAWLDDHAAVLVDPLCPSSLLYVGLAALPPSSRRGPGCAWRVRAEAWSRWADLSESECAGVVGVVARATRAVVGAQTARHAARGAPGRAAPSLHPATAGTEPRDVTALPRQ